MGWRFQKRISLGGLRYTISRRGLGTSWGLFGIFRVGVSSNGRRFVSVRIPGSGVSWVKYSSPSGSSTSQPGAASTTAQTPNPGTPQAPQQPQQQPQSNRAGTPWWRQKNLGS